MEGWSRHWICGKYHWNRVGNRVHRRRQWVLARYKSVWWKAMPRNFYKEMDTHIWINPEQPDFLNLLFTFIQAFLHIITYTVYTISPFLSPSRQNCQCWWQNHNLTPSWLHRPTHVVVFKMLLQFGTGTKTRRRQIGANGEWTKTKQPRCSTSAAAIALL